MTYFGQLFAIYCNKIREIIAYTNKIFKTVNCLWQQNFLLHKPITSNFITTPCINYSNGDLFSFDFLQFFVIQRLRFNFHIARSTEFTVPIKNESNNNRIGNPRCHFQNPIRFEIQQPPYFFLGLCEYLYYFPILS